MLNEFLKMVDAICNTGSVTAIDDLRNASNKATVSCIYNMTTVLIEMSMTHSIDSEMQGYVPTLRLRVKVGDEAMLNIGLHSSEIRDQAKAAWDKLEGKIAAQKREEWREFWDSVKIDAE